MLDAGAHDIGHAVRRDDVFAVGPASARPGVDLLGMLRRNFAFLAAICLLGLLAAAAFAFALPEVYTARTTLVLERKDPSLFESVPETQRQQLDREAIDTELQLINSREIAARVVDRLKLVDDPYFSTEARMLAEEGGEASVAGPFAFLVDWGLLETSSIVSTRSLISDLRGRILGSPAERSEVGAALLRENTITSFIGRVFVTRAGGSLALNVQATHSRGADAALISDTIATEYIAATVGRRREATRKAIDYLTNRAADLGLDIARLEQAMIAHRQNFDLDDADAPKALRAELDQLQVKLSLARARSALQTEVAALEQSVAQVRQRLTARAAAEIRLSQYERDVTTGQERHRQVVARLGNLDLQAEPLNAPARIVSAAQVPAKPTSPKRFLIALAGATGAGLFGLLFVLLREAGDTRIRTEADIRQIGTIPNLGHVPEVRQRWWRLGGRPHDAMTDEPNSLYAHALRNLLIGCRRMTDGAPSWAVIVTSCSPSDGKTSLSLALAATAARSGRSTVLVDFDTQRPGMTRLLEMDPDTTGLRDYAVGRCPIEDAIGKAAESALLPNGVDFARTGGFNASDGNDPLNDDAMAGIVRELRSRYDVVVIDSPPATLFDEVGQLAAAADLTLLVLRWGETTRPVLESVLAKLEWFSQTPIATVLNRVDPRSRAHASDVMATERSYAAYLG